MKTALLSHLFGTGGEEPGQNLLVPEIPPPILASVGEDFPLPPPLEEVGGTPPIFVDDAFPEPLLARSCVLLRGSRGGVRADVGVGRPVRCLPTAPIDSRGLHGNHCATRRTDGVAVVGGSGRVPRASPCTELRAPSWVSRRDPHRRGCLQTHSGPSCRSNRFLRTSQRLRWFSTSSRRSRRGRRRSPTRSHHRSPRTSRAACRSRNLLRGSGPLSTTRSPNSPCTEPACSFVGLEEGSAPTWVSADPFGAFLPLPPTPEDFGGSLPLEESSAFAWVALEIQWITVPISEDSVAATTTTLDEQPTLPTWTPTIPDAQFPAIPEDFAGSFPLDEQPLPPWVAPEPLWLTVPIGEEFAAVCRSRNRPRGCGRSRSPTRSLRPSPRTSRAPFRSRNRPGGSGSPWRPRGSRRLSARTSKEDSRSTSTRIFPRGRPRSPTRSLRPSQRTSLAPCRSKNRPGGSGSPWRPRGSRPHRRGLRGLLPPRRTADASHVDANDPRRAVSCGPPGGLRGFVSPRTNSPLPHGLRSRRRGSRYPSTRTSPASLACSMNRRRPTWTPTIPDAFAPSIPEDFAGSLPLEEPPGWMWVSLETPWITVPDQRGLRRLLPARRAPERFPRGRRRSRMRSRRPSRRTSQVPSRSKSRPVGFGCPSRRRGSRYPINEDFAGFFLLDEQPTLPTWTPTIPDSQFPVYPGGVPRFAPARTSRPAASWVPLETPWMTYPIDEDFAG